jgi:hypothetical protein
MCKVYNPTNLVQILSGVSISLQFPIPQGSPNLRKDTLPNQKIMIGIMHEILCELAKAGVELPSMAELRLPNVEQMFNQVNPAKKPSTSPSKRASHVQSPTLPISPTPAMKKAIAHMNAFVLVLCFYLWEPDVRRCPRQLENKGPDDFPQLEKDVNTIGFEGLVKSTQRTPEQSILLCTKMRTWYVN